MGIGYIQRQIILRNIGHDLFMLSIDSHSICPETDSTMILYLDNLDPYVRDSETQCQIPTTSRFSLVGPQRTTPDRKAKIP